MWRLGKMFEDLGFTSTGSGGLKKAPRRREASTRHRVLRCELLEDRRLLAASVGLNFTGSTLGPDSGSIPPDTDGAVGLAHYVELINGRYSVYDKSNGFKVQTSTLNQFWKNAGIPSSTVSSSFDPRVVFDHSSQRWFATSVDNRRSADSNFLLGVSDNSDPTLGWTAFSIDADPANDRWADFPMLGVDATGVSISLNMFDITDVGDDEVTTASLFTFPKSDLIGATPVIDNLTAFRDLSLNTVGFSAHPTIDYGPDDGRASFLATRGDTIRRTNITGAGAAGATLGVTSSIAIAGYIGPSDADQPGDKQDIDTGSSKFSSATFEIGNSIWGAYSVDFGGRAAIRWHEIDETSNAVLQTGTIFDPSLEFFFPSIAANQFGEVVIGFSGTSTTQFVSAYVVAGETDGGITTFGAPLLTASGTADYENLDSATPPRNRWGDYSSTSLDPTDEQVFWTIQEFVSSTDVWSTKITQIIFESVGPTVSINSLLTNDVTPDLTGSISDPEATIVLSVGTQTGLVPTNNGDGTWTLPGSSLIPLSEGVYEISVTATNAELLQGTDETTNELVIDTNFVFLENFVSTSFDTSNWISTGSTTIDDVGIDETSGPFAARFNGHPIGGDILTSALIDLSSATGADFLYSYQRRGGGDSPEIGEDLVFEYRDSAGDWKELDRQLGSELDMITFESIVLTLPASALHSEFQFRILSASTTNPDLPFDDWFVDAIGIKATPNDPAVQFTQSNYSVSEGNFESLVVEVARNDNSGVSEVLVRVTGGTATLGSDYSGSTFPVNFAVGETSKLVPITLIDDPALEPTETIELTLSRISNSKIGFQSTSTLSILDDGLPGDYDRNGVVDLEDEQLWRSTFGNVVSPFVDADGNGNGRIDVADYSVWRDNYVPIINLDILRADVAPVIDGSIDGVWQGVDAIPLEFAFGNIASTADLSAEWRVLWDDTALYLYAEVTDDVLKLDSLANVFDDDGVELFIDPDYSHGNTYDSNDAQWMLRPFGSIAHPGNNTQTTAGTEVVYATSFTGTAYAIEASIPWSALGVTPTAGHQIGIDIAVQDDDDGGNVDFSGVDGRLTWHDQQNIAAQNPSVFGPAILSSQVAVPPASSAASTGATSDEVAAIDEALLPDDSSVAPLQAKPQLLDYFALDNDTPSTTPQARLPFRASLGESFARHDHLLLLTALEVPYAVDPDSSLEALDAAFAEDDMSDSEANHEDWASSIETPFQKV